MPDFRSSEIFRRIVEQLEVGVYIVDRARKIQFWNHGAERITGFLAQDVVGRFCRDNILVHYMTRTRVSARRNVHSPKRCASASNRNKPYN
jgi:PAS domain S-box-containing protein